MTACMNWTGVWKKALSDSWSHVKFSSSVQGSKKQFATRILPSIRCHLGSSSMHSLNWLMGPNVLLETSLQITNLLFNIPIHIFSFWANKQTSHLYGMGRLSSTAIQLKHSLVISINFSSTYSTWKFCQGKCRHSPWCRDLFLSFPS